MASRRSFGLVHLQPRVTSVLNEVTGREGGRIREHRDGRTDVRIMPEAIRIGPDRLPDLNALRRAIYDHERSRGLTHDQAIAKLFPDGRITR